MTPPVSWMHAFLDLPADAADQARAFWSAALGWSPGEPWPDHPEFTSFVPPDGASYLHVQVVDAPQRVHLDLLGDLESDPARLAELGATRGERHAAWQVMSSPAGLPFCVCSEPWPHARPGPVTWPDGHRSRLVQLCVDVPDGQHDREFRFWQAATGWAEEEIDDPEFRRLVHRAESPLQLLVQRLGPDDGADRARAHLDLGTDDRRAEIVRLAALGATTVGEGDGFTVLRDPLGLPFCVTDNDPAR